MTTRIHIVINPASGRPKPILQILNDILRPRGVQWDVSLTKNSGDAERSSRRAAESGADVVAAYGGDGTVMEVARGLIGLETPMAILPGGTANLMGVELGIPKNIRQAVEIAADENSVQQWIDVGKVGDEYFLLRVGMGFAARKVQYADRKMKDRFGVMAYTLAAVKAITAKNSADYRLTVDGKVHEIRSVACQVYNAGNMGRPGTALAPGISVTDGLLDLLAVREEAMLALLTRGADFSVSHSDELFYHWKGRQLSIQAEPPQVIHLDGEIVGKTPVEVEVLPRAIKVLTPKGGSLAEGL
jgi:YegS/Rv2252/BmrU family lipid kinase